jgi:hypothetical protein
MNSADEAECRDVWGVFGKHWKLDFKVLGVGLDLRGVSKHWEVLRFVA